MMRFGESNYKDIRFLFTAKLNDLFKVQLYSYMYQHDSGDGGMRMWWIAGLAQAIDSNIKIRQLVDNPNQNICLENNNNLNHNSNN